ncbi:MAG: hypothetical protein KDB23_13500 [Planctomycetales bacterium]|nr:hypothetical protein [Planctomycetales bacterium]
MKPPTCRRRAATKSAGLSLLELIIALAILVGTSSLLLQLVDLGSRHSDRALQITDAQTVAHNLMAEMLAGLRPWDASETYQPVDSWSPWEYRLKLEPIGFGQLAAATLIVAPRTDMPVSLSGDAIAPVAVSPPVTAAGDSTATTLSQLDTEAIRPGSYRLTRWIRQASSSAASETDGDGSEY